MVPADSFFTLSDMALCSACVVLKAAKAGLPGLAWSAAWLVGVVNGGFIITSDWLSGAISTSMARRSSVAPKAICWFRGRTAWRLVPLMSSSSSEPTSTTGLPLLSNSPVPPKGYSTLRVPV